jgi:hypothetical protein
MKKVSGVFVHATNSDLAAMNAFDAAAAFINQTVIAPARDASGRARGLFKPNVIAQSLQIFASQYTSGSPSIAELLYSTTAQGALADKAGVRRIWSGSRSVLSTDSLRYDVWVETTTPAVGGGFAGGGGIEIELLNTPFNGRTALLNDTGGRLLTREPAGARGAWVSRQISCAGIAGNTITGFSLCHDGDAVGTYRSLYRNVRLADSGGADKQVFWRGGFLQRSEDYITAEHFDVQLSPQGTPTDGAAFWRTGSVYVMRDVIDIIKNPDYGFSEETDHAESRNTIINGQDVVASVGTRFDVLKGKFQVQASDKTVDSLLLAMRTGVVVIDMELTDFPSYVWPIRASRVKDSRSLNNPAFVEIEFEAKEVV